VGLTAGFDVALATPAVTHPSFIEGRAAALEVDGTSVGVLGELHPQIITDAGIEVPVAGFECMVSAFSAE
jgi:phenylalanyl-tRNA synthetase beta chain